MSRNNPYRHRPLLLRAANLGSRLGLQRVFQLHPDQLLADAGMQQSAADSWSEGYRRLCLALQQEARLNLVGRIAARSHLLQLLRNRHTIDVARRRDPAIASEAIRAPLFLTGLPRTGSTLLHNLLAQDPQLAAPLTWQVMLAGPPPGTDSVSDQRRIAKTRRMLRWLDRLAPRFRAIHPTGPLLPQECIAITAQQFASLEFHTTFHVPSYQQWLDQNGYLEAFRFHHRFIQHLQRGRDAAQWVFKAPAHLIGLADLVAVYPDARFVFTHREPETVIASIASHGVVLRNAFSDEVDNTAVARYWLQWWANAWRRADAFRQSHPGQSIDIRYQELVADPIATVRQLYDRLGWNWNGALEQRMRDFVVDNTQHKYGRHSYSLQQFGLDPESVRKAFGSST